MLRVVLHRGISVKSLLPSSTPTNVCNSCVRRQSSSFPSSSSTTKIGLGVTALLASGGALAYGYYKLDQLQDEIHKGKINQDMLNKKSRQLKQQLDEAQVSERLLLEKLAILENKKDDVKRELIDLKGEESGKDELKTEGRNDGEEVDKIDMSIDSDMKASVEQKYQRMIKKVRDELEEELRHHLKRQLSAHHDHLQEQLKVLARELDRKHQIILEDSILMEKSRYQSDLSDSMHRLNTLEGILKVRDELDKDERTAKELWLASQSLMDALKHKNNNVKGDVVPKQLDKEISVVKQTLQEYSKKNMLAELALESISKDNLGSVYSEDDLIHRFDKIERLCKRVALIGDESASLFKYLLSYVQSMLVFNNYKISHQELSDEQVIDTSKWDTFDILARVRHSLNCHNLEMALRYANQLKGEPRRVAKDWINDARIHLEIRQAANVISSQAASISAQVLK